MRNGAILFLALLFALPAPGAAQTGALDRIRQKGVITLGYIDGAAPFSFDGRGQAAAGLLGGHVPGDRASASGRS